MKQSGLTLVELLVVLTIIGVLAAIAVPTYQNSVMKSRRTDASMTLSKMQMVQEKYRMNNSQYGSLHDLGLVGNGITTVSSDGGFYNISVSNISETGYVFTAAAKAGTSQEEDVDCQSIVLTQDGGNTVLTPSSCWGK